MTRRVKLVCTLGPATAAAGAVRALAEAGAGVFRVNLSHGTPGSRRDAVEAVRRAGEELGRDLAVMADLPGPKIRLGELAAEPVLLREGAPFVLRAAGGPGDATGAATSYPFLAQDLRPGDRVFLADGSVELVVRETRAADVVTEVVRGGHLRSRAGVNVPAERLSLPAVTEADRRALREAFDLGADLLAQSFVRRGEDVAALRALAGRAPIVAKVETRPAVERAGEVLAQADALMVARGDLGVELPMEEIPVLQKELLRAAREAGKPAVVATQMLESMVHAPRPTRAEASDVANAVLDGADAIMLSAETAVGEYPLEAVRAASRIAEVAEARAGPGPGVVPRREADDPAAAVARAAAGVCAVAGAVAIACFTRTGRTAALIASERPPVPVYAFSPDAATRRALALRWGVRTLPAPDPADTDAMIALLDQGLRERAGIAPGQLVVLVAASPAGKARTNMLKVHRTGEPVR